MKRNQIDRNQVLDRVVNFVQEHHQQQEQSLFLKFIKIFYHTAPLDMLDSAQAKDLYGAALSVWSMLKHRTLGKDQCRLFNPGDEEFPWNCEHSLLAVVTETKPFLVDSLRIALTRAGCTVYSFVNATALSVQRTSMGDIVDFSITEKPDLHRESYLLIEINYLDAEAMPNIEAQLKEVLNDVAFAVQDWEPMKLKMKKEIQRLDHLPSHFESSEIGEVKAFFEWLLEYFTFIGYREYAVTGSGENKALKLVEKSGLGVLNQSKNSPEKQYYIDLPKAMREHALSNHLILITKTNTLSTIHRAVYTDIIICKSFNEKGEVVGEQRFIGLFTSDAYDSDPSRIPLLRERVRKVMAASNESMGLYERKRLLHILKRLPRDELFQSNLEELTLLCNGILDIQERRVTRLFARKDICNRFVSCLICVPRDNYSTELRIKMQRVLIESFHGEEILANPIFSESPLAMVHFVIRIDSNQEHTFNVDEIEQKIVQLASSWQDHFEMTLLKQVGAAQGHRLFMNYQWAFSPAFKSLYSGSVGAKVVQILESLEAQDGLHIELIQGDQEDSLLRIYQLDQFLPLSDAIPILENMGMRTIGERLFEIKKPDDHIVYLSEFSVEYQSMKDSNHLQQDCFHEALRRVWLKKAESDAFNQLVLLSQIQWFEVRILRAYARYLKQIGFSLTEQYIQSTFSKFPNIAKQIVMLFHLRFDPALDQARMKRFKEARKKLLESISEVDTADQDRIIRMYIALIEATMRVNVYQSKVSDYLSFKLNSAAVPDLPLPKPLYEIFVFSERVEGIHLRADKVARGGIRWSDRREDFRTEILGLMKAQQGKNTLIVPAGAKGGFITKKITPSMDQNEVKTESVECYKLFISGLLDLTDNLINNKLIKPDQVIAYDDDDPYLVVAADRGTATFSDIANEVSSQYNFWLMDAFASGGSTGYDHKEMGITARGAWASVEWHFKALNQDINKPFSVVGIGEMAGDVFGNGMLLSDKIQLVAAFNHQYIFIDPNPNPTQSFRERQRLFNTPGSRWSDYDHDLLSAGGAIYGRYDKFIQLSQEACARFKLENKPYRPEALIRHLLASEVDLIWNGGIGTFVRSKNETDIQVGDHANNSLRIEGRDLRCRVFAEGGNLGLTQLGRIEYALSNGVINTDFIDNSGGVDCSDHEVNIKIFLNTLVNQNQMTLEARNQLLLDMKPNVAEMVLKHNADQNLALSIESLALPTDLASYEAFIEYASVERGILDPALEYLPTKQDVSDRLSYKMSLTRPELSVLLSYSKMILQHDILKTALVDAPACKAFLEASFPLIMRDQMGDRLWDHPLRKEMISTHLSNAFINELGITFLTELSEECELAIVDIISAYMMVRKIFKVQSIYDSIQSYENTLPFELLMTFHHSLRMFLRRAVRWVLNNHLVALDQLESTELNNLAESIQALLVILPSMLRGPIKEEYEALIEQLTPYNFSEDSIQMMSYIPLGYAALNIAQASLEQHTDIKTFAPLYFIFSEKMDIYWLRSQLATLPLETHWDRSARYHLKGELDCLQRDLAMHLYQYHQNLRVDQTFDQVIDAWFAEHESLIHVWAKRASDLSKRKQLNFSMIFVLINELSRLNSMLKSL
ncbi:MAG: NAD-glutamate dehydrogenase [Legionellales bacterium]|nr:NAD-glutamate dehydrogenase [Legionellales bacterium]